jgi:hypothetical protein
MRKNTLAVDRMTDGSLWLRLESRLIDLDQPWPISGHQRSVWAKEARLIARELRMRGTQLQLPDVG